MLSLQYLLRVLLCHSEITFGFLVSSLFGSKSYILIAQSDNYAAHSDNYAAQSDNYAI
jgi:hypothetical protein